MIIGPRDGAKKNRTHFKSISSYKHFIQCIFVYTTKKNQLEGFRQLQHLPVNVVLSVLAWEFGTHDPTWVNTQSLHHACLNQNFSASSHAQGLPKPKKERNEQRNLLEESKKKKVPLEALEESS